MRRVDNCCDQLAVGFYFCNRATQRHVGRIRKRNGRQVFPVDGMALIALHVQKGIATRYGIAVRQAEADFGHWIAITGAERQRCNQDYSKRGFRHGDTSCSVAGIAEDYWYHAQRDGGIRDFRSTVTVRAGLTSQ